MKKIVRSAVGIAAAILLSLAVIVFADSPNYTRVTTTASYAKGEVQIQPSYIEPLINAHAYRAHLKFKVYDNQGNVSDAVELYTQPGLSKYDSNIYNNTEYVRFGNGYTYTVLISNITWVPDDTDYWPTGTQVTE